MIDLIKSKIQGFDPISLAEMDSVSLMDRSDFKFVFPVELLAEILDNMKTDYRVLEINSIRLQAYESLYFDSPDFLLFNDHHKGKLNRYKLRFRKYVNSKGLTFFEIKFKNNKGRTLKTRIKVDDIPLLISDSERAEKFLEDTTPLSGSDFVPSLWSDYTRVTMVSKSGGERLTIDLDLRFRKPGGNEPAMGFPRMVIAEVKQDKANFQSPFMRLIRGHQVREGGISKYCFGIFSCYEGLKKNTFKPKVREIHKSLDSSNYPALNKPG